MPFSQTLLPEFEEEMKNTRKILECVPDGKFDYQPHAKSMTLGRLASHVAELPGWTTFTLDREVLELGPDFKPDIASSRAELLQKFDTLGPTRTKSPRRAMRIGRDVDLKWAGQTIMSIPRSEVMRGTIMNHLVHHRAQLGVYLRLNNVAFPGMYGPSADEPSFLTANSAA
jgi:uncharacterized damage-inducible protein DinB